MEPTKRRDRPRCALVLLIGILLAMPALAGCIGGDAGDDAAGPAGTADGDGADAGGADGAEAGDGFAVLTFDAEEALDETRWFNGTYTPQETCLAGGYATGDAERAHDVADVLPAGRVVQLTVEMQYEPGAVTFGQHVQTWINSEDALFYRWTTPTWEIGRIVMDITVMRRSGSFEVVAFSFAPQGDTSTELDYTLRVDAQALPDRVPAGVPVAAELSPGQTLTVHAYDEGEPSFTLFGPDDARLGTFADATAATYTVPDDGPAGAYVLVSGDTDLHLVLEAAEGPDGGDAADADEAAPLLPLGLEGESETVDVYDGTGEVTWEFDAADRLLGAGIFVRTRHAAAGVGPWTTTGFDLQVTSPGGDTAEGGFPCTGCFGVSPFLGWFSTGTGFGTGNPSVVDGTYGASLASDAAAGFEYGHWTLRYAR